MLLFTPSASHAGRLASMSLLAAALALTPGRASAQSHPGVGPWTVDIGSDRAHVSNSGASGAWSVDHLQVGWARQDIGGFFAGVERHARYGLTDLTLAANGYWRRGDRTVALGAGATPGASFLYRAALQGEFSQRVAGSLVASFGYRYLAFRQADVHQLQPALTWYHSRGDIQARHFTTVNAAEKRRSHALMVRTSYALGRRVRVGGGFAAGDRIFDVASLPGGSAGSTAQFAHVRVAVTPRDAVETGVMRADEEPAFRYRALTIRYVRSF